MTTYRLLAGLPLQIDSYRLEGLVRDVSSGFRRHTTLIRLCGGGEEGVGEDVVYDAEDHRALQEAGPALPLAGRYTLAGFSGRLDELELFPAPPARPSSRDYRRWAFESAALDLALRQNGETLAGRLGRPARPVQFVVSLRLDEPPSAAAVKRWLALEPSLRFKLDPTSSWGRELIEELNGTGAVEVLDLKGFYKGTIVDQQVDTELYARVFRGFPNARIEDPVLAPATEPILSEHRERISWDAPIHGIADIEALPFPPRVLNIKPSRFGKLQTLFDTYDYCSERGIELYGGGQFELGPGRGQIQYLASLFHPGAANDVAPSGYNDPGPAPGLPPSPLPPRPAARGFRWSDEDELGQG